MSDLLTRVHIHRVLIQVHPDRTMAKDLESWFKIALLPLYKMLVAVARVSNFGLSATEFSKVVFNTIRMVMSHELSQNASSEATRVWRSSHVSSSTRRPGALPQSSKGYDLL